MDQAKLKKIQQFIEGNLSYHEASSLFFELCRNKQYALRLIANHTKSNERQLIAEFKSILHKQPGYFERLAEGFNGFETEESTIDDAPVTLSFDVPEPPQEEIANSPESKVFNGTKPSTPIEASAVQSFKELLRSRGSLHGQLLEAQSDERRLEIARELMSFQSKINKLKLDIENIRKGAIPAVTTMINSSLTGEQVRRMSNLNNYLRRETNKLKKTTDPAVRRKIQSKIEEFQTELNELAGQQKTVN